MKFKHSIFLTIILLVACTSLPYKDDVGFLVSAQANSPEFSVYINGSLCRDMDGLPGMCSKRIHSGDNVKLHFDPQSYAYNMTIACSRPITIAGATVPANQAEDIVISSQDMQGLGSFVCIGEVFPDDRSQPMSAKWEIRVVITDTNYVAREGAQIVKDGKANYLVLGQYARTSWVYDQGVWTPYTKKTTVKLKGDPAQVQAVSESYQSRFNYFNFKGPVAVADGN